MSFELDDVVKQNICALVEMCRYKLGDIVNAFLEILDDMSKVRRGFIRQMRQFEMHNMLSL